jgi:hypothetical protein
MLALLAINFISFIACLLLLNDPLKNENKGFLVYNLFYGFLTQFVDTKSKASTLYSAKVLSKEVV